MSLLFAASRFQRPGRAVSILQLLLLLGAISFGQFAVAGPPAPTQANVPYGKHERQVLDFYKAESKEPTPVVFFIHGGGWSGGNKEGAQKTLDLPRLLSNGISVVSINYRYVQMAQSAGVQPPVKWPLEDAARALQFVRSKAAAWNLDKKRIGACGGSAGACSSLWLAMHDDMAQPTSDDPVARESTRLWCAAVIGAQTALDPQLLREWMPNMVYGGHAFGFRTTDNDRTKEFQRFFEGREKVVPFIREYSPIEHASKDDPPLWLSYTQTTLAVKGEAQKDPTHSALLGMMLEEKLKPLGVEVILTYPAKPSGPYKNATDYLVARLKPAVAATPADRAKKMNVLFIAVDDLKPALACAGDPLARTPNIDKLAARGTTFTRAYCQQAVCSPSRSSLLTGRRPDSTRVYDLVTHFRKALPDVVTLPQHFKNNGYYAHGVGKIYHPGYNDEPSWSVPWEGTKARAYGPNGQKVLAEVKAKAKAAGQDLTKARGLPAEAPEVADDYLNDGWTANRAIEILKARTGKPEPFFLAVGFAKPHLPFVAPKKYWDLYDPARLPVAESADPPQAAPKFAPQFGGELRAYHEIPKSGPVPKQTARHLVHGYYAAVSYMDAQVGRVLDALKEQGLADNTVVILWGDHGWHLGDHGMWCKHTNYERATRAALLMSLPGQKTAGQTSDALVEFVDIYPTLAEVCQLPKPVGVEGYSFARLLDDPKQPWKAAAFSQYPRGGKETGPLMGYALRTDRYRYVEWRKRDSGEVVARELYDHQHDPEEDRNVAGDAANQAVVEKLAKQLAGGWQNNAPPK